MGSSNLFNLCARGISLALLAIAVMACTAQATPIPAPSPTPTVVPIPTATPDIEATVAARLQATIKALPTATAIPTPTTTPVPTPTAVPTPTPRATSTPTPTPTPTPAPTPTPTATPTPEPTATPTAAVPTPTIPMSSYRSAQYPFTIQYPAQWAEQPKLEGITAMFLEGGGSSANFIIGETDLVASGLGEMALEDYVDFSIFGIKLAIENYEILSRQRTVNAQGLPLQILTTSGGPGGIIKSSMLFYVHENTIGFVAQYTALKLRYQELEPLTAFSFSSFRVAE